MEQRIAAGELLVGGRYWVGVGHSIVRFPKPQQPIVFADASILGRPANTPLIARTIEGLPFTLQVSVYYKLTTAEDSATKAAQLGTIYANFGNAWEDFLTVVSEAGIKSVCSRHYLEEFFSEREAIESEVKDKLSSEFQLYHIQLTGVYVLDLKFAKEIEEAVHATEKAKQEVAIYEKLKEREEILKDTRIALAKITRDIEMGKTDSFKKTAAIYKTGEISGDTYIWDSYDSVLTNLQVISLCKQ